MVHRYATGMIPFYGPAIVRLVTGIVFAAHGAQKLFGLWGGGGLSDTPEAFSPLGFHPAHPLAITVGVIEFAGGILLMLGAFTTIAAIPLLLTLVVATWRVHLPHGFFLNWSLAPGQGHGVEFNLVLFGALVSLLFTGPGAFSVDGYRAASAAAEAAGRARIRAGKV